jgi:hypothetical protein
MHLSKSAGMLYLCSDCDAQSEERGLHWADPDVGIGSQPRPDITVARDGTLLRPKNMDAELLRYAL